jgi:hypothetical protein
VRLGPRVATGLDLRTISTTWAPKKCMGARQAREAAILRAGRKKEIEATTTLTEVIFFIENVRDGTRAKKKTSKYRAPRMTPCSIAHTLWVALHL